MSIEIRTDYLGNTQWFVYEVPESNSLIRRKIKHHQNKLIIELSNKQRQSEQSKAHARETMSTRNYRLIQERQVEWPAGQAQTKTRSSNPRTCKSNASLRKQTSTAVNVANGMDAAKQAHRTAEGACGNVIEKQVDETDQASCAKECRGEATHTHRSIAQNEKGPRRPPGQAERGRKRENHKENHQENARNQGQTKGSTGSRYH